MTDLYFDLEQLVKAVAQLLPEWVPVTSEIREVVTIQHVKKSAQIRFRFIVHGTHEGQIKMFGRLCGDLEQHNPVFNDIFPSGDTKITKYINPQRSLKSIADDIKRRVIPDLMEIVSQAEEKQRKANEARLRILGDEESLITASLNQLYRVEQNKELTYYDRKRGRSVTASVQDPGAVPGNVRLTLDVDADEAGAVLSALFEHWREMRYPNEYPKKTKARR